jgi:hypothetical protein
MSGKNMACKIGEEEMTKELWRDKPLAKKVEIIESILDSLSVQLESNPVEICPEMFKILENKNEEAYAEYEKAQKEVMALEETASELLKITKDRDLLAPDGASLLPELPTAKPALQSPDNSQASILSVR